MKESNEDLIPEGTWTCPGCEHIHKAPHYTHPGQVDYSKRPTEKGRITFNRRQKDDNLDYDTSIKNDLLGEPDPFDEEGYQKPLFCPHCGWEQDWLIIKRTGPLRSLIDQFLDVMNGRPENLTANEALQQFMGFLKGKGVVG